MENDCIHLKEIFQFKDQECVICELTHTILKAECYLKCNLYNVNLSKEKICLNCEHYLGGNDWGLACSVDYHMLCEALDNMCKNGKMRGITE